MSSVLPSLPAEVRDLIREAEERIDKYYREHGGRSHGFVPSCFVSVHEGLRRVANEDLAAGVRFCEWGSGFGVVAALAAIEGFDAYGIEIQAELVEEAASLVDYLGIEASYVHGTFIPEGSEHIADGVADYAWQEEGVVPGYQELELDLDDFDVIYVYPWPGEESLVEELFDQYAAVGALLLTYHGSCGLTIQRKTSATTGQLATL